jgi:hypothetical protein
MVENGEVEIHEGPPGSTQLLEPWTAFRTRIMHWITPFVHRLA